ncbi:MAG: DUF29 domain-containing protein [Thiothrix sp.]
MGAVAYDEDLYSWSLEQAKLLRERKFDQIDLEHIIEEIEDMSKSEKRALESFLETLLMHLLKWQYQPFYIGKRSWAATIVEQRKRIKWHLEDNPGLKSKLSAAIVRAYDLAKAGAEKETGIPSSSFPEICPWEYEQFMDADFWPEPAE